MALLTLTLNVTTMLFNFLHVDQLQVGMKMVGNGRKNPLTVPATVFFCRERKWERKNRTENEIGITGYQERN